MMRGLAKLTWVEIKIFVREPMGVIGTVGIPVILFLLLGRIAGERDELPADALSWVDVRLPVFASLFITLGAVLSLIAVISIYREGGILKRLRATPLRPATILSAHVIVKLLLSALTLVLLVAARRRFYPAGIEGRPGELHGGAAAEHAQHSVDRLHRRQPGADRAVRAAHRQRVALSDDRHLGLVRAARAPAAAVARHRAGPAGDPRRGPLAGGVERGGLGASLAQRPGAAGKPGRLHHNLQPGVSMGMTTKIQMIVGVVALAATGAVGTTTEKFDNSNPSWSPDGRFAAFYSDRTGSRELYLYDFEQQTSRQLTETEDHVYSAHWAADSASVVYYQGRNTKFEAYRLGVEEGSVPEQLTTTRKYVSSPSLSPDGSRLAFSSNLEDPTEHEIYVLDLASGELAQLTDNEQSDWSPVWSPDGSEIAFISDRATRFNFDIYVMKADGSDPRALPDLAPHEYYPEWSPDGERILFFAGENRRKFDLWTVDLASGEHSRVTRRVRSGRGSFSPDGSRIVLSAWTEQGDRLFVVAAAGRRARAPARAIGSRPGRGTRRAGAISRLAATGRRCGPARPSRRRSSSAGAITQAPVGGRRSRLATFSRPGTLDWLAIRCTQNSVDGP